MRPDHRITIEPCPKRIRAVVGDRTVVDSLAALLLLETGREPVYYFPRCDVRMDLLRASRHHDFCPWKGDACFWNMEGGDRTIKNAVWSLERAMPATRRIEGLLGIGWAGMDRWLEEDEEVFGHPRDPHHRIDARASLRKVRVHFGGETIAETRRGLFLFETGMPARYYIPPQDVRIDLLVPTGTSSVCPYKGTASYWQIEAGGRVSRDAVWSYANPLPDAPQIGRFFCFSPDKVDGFDVEWTALAGRAADDALAPNDEAFRAVDA